MAHWGNRWVPQRLNRGGQRGFKIGSLLVFFKWNCLITTKSILTWEEAEYCRSPLQAGQRHYWLVPALVSGDSCRASGNLERQVSVGNVFHCYYTCILTYFHHQRVVGHTVWPSFGKSILMQYYSNFLLK